MRSAKNSAEAGFSLMEMLLVAAILPVVFFAVFANMSSGMRAWKAFNRPISEEETVLFLDRAQFDFANAFLYTPVPFVGDAHSVDFAGTVPSPPELGGDRGIGRIEYRYDAAQRLIVREETDFSALHKDAPGRPRAVMGGVTDFSLEYLSYTESDGRFAWKEEWQPGKRPLPAAVRMTVQREEGDPLVKTFLVPGGN